MSKNTLFIHSGVHRTGTSRLQYCLGNNRLFLAEQGLIYPFDQMHHLELATGLRYGSLNGDDLTARLISIPLKNNEFIVLSSEDFCTIESSDWLKPLAEAFDLKIVFYMRRQDIWLNSWYNQNIKWPFDRDLSSATPQIFLEFIDRFPWIDYKTVLDRWATVVDAGSLLLGVVESEQVTDVVADFFVKVGLSSVKIPTTRLAPENKSASPLVLEILRHLLPNMLEDFYWDILKELPEIVDSIHPEVNRMVFTPDERRDVLNRFQISNAEVAEKYLSRENGRLFYQSEIKDTDPYTRAVLPDSDELLRLIISPLLNRILLKNKIYASIQYSRET